MQPITLPPGYVPTAIPAPEPVASPLSPGAPPPAPAPAPAPAPEPEPLPFGYTLTAGAAVQRSDGALVPADPANPAWQEYQRWLAAGHTAAPYVAPPAVVLSNEAMLASRFAKRAAAKDHLLATMAAENVGRVQDGTWTAQDLTGLLSALAPVLAMVQSLSYELAAQAIASSTHPLLTPAIKAGWVAKLQAHFYPEG